jgi:hypothetical protein
MPIVRENVVDLFEELLTDLRCRQDTRAYIVGIFAKHNISNLDLSGQSITVLFSQARDTGNFTIFQRLGDWLMFCNGIASEHLRFASRDYYDTVARMSYYACYRLLNRSWPAYEELADNFLVIKKQVKDKLSSLII